MIPFLPVIWSFLTSFVFKIGLGIVVLIAIAAFSWQIRSHFAEFDRLQVAENLLSGMIEDEVERSNRNQAAYDRQMAKVKKTLVAVNHQLVHEKRKGVKARDQIIKLQSLPESADGPIANVLRHTPTWLLDSAEAGAGDTGGGGNKANGTREP